MEHVEQEARGMGWVPQEEFRGDVVKWVDAQTFVDRGHTIMPILRKNNERLENMSKKQQEEIAELRKTLADNGESIQELKNVHAEATKAAVEKARRDLMSELKLARQEGDVDREVEIQDGLDQLRAHEKTIAAAVTEPKPPQSSQQGADTAHPDFKGWMEENTWFGSDQRKTMRAMGVAQELRGDPQFDKLEGRAFFDKVLQVMDERSGVRVPSKVDEPRASGSSASGGGKSYNDMPADAKAKCDEQARKLVGAGRAFKDQAEWRKYYTNLYFQEN